MHFFPIFISIYLIFYRYFNLGFRTRKELKEDLPDLKCADVASATIRIQKVFRGYQARKRVEDLKEEVKNPKLAKTAVKIQSVQRGFHQTRQPKPKKKQQPAKRSWADVAMAAMIIQRAYRKYKARKDIDLKDPELATAAVKIQTVYRGFKTRKVCFLAFFSIS